jgi:hypothetical protein
LQALASEASVAALLAIQALVPIHALTASIPQAPAMSVTFGLPMTSSGAKVICSISGAYVAGCTGRVVVAAAEPSLIAADPTVVAKDFVFADVLARGPKASLFTSSATHTIPTRVTFAEPT